MVSEIDYHDYQKALQFDIRISRMDALHHFSQLERAVAELRSLYERAVFSIESCKVFKFLFRWQSMEEVPKGLIRKQCCSK